ncbi:MAG: class I SAM-dependent methyltransferase, partial [Isosphaeraceae bacterium]|nr:class I SAM-dependent methyltransferase [Isosphaeraceae bacterium]
MSAEALPDYEPVLAAYHAAFAPELRRMIGALPLKRGDRVLDVACGDGAYTPWLAERVQPDGLVVALDISPAYLAVARRKPAPSKRAGYIAAALERLPFAEGTFDFAWCAQSLFSLPEPVAALQQMARVVRPGGFVAVLEDDALHQLLLPWPIEIELAVRAAELAAFAAESPRPRKYYVGRHLRQVFETAGLVACRRRTWASDRQAPLEDAEKAFLHAYLHDLRDRVADHLGREARAALDALVGG